MRTVKRSVQIAIQQIRSEVDLYGVLVSALEVQYRSDAIALQKFTQRAKRLVYSSTIIGCYGLIEQTVDSILISVAEAYGQLYARYDELPETVRKSHRDLLLQCLRGGSAARTRQEVDEPSALEALGLAPNKPAKLVAFAFTLSSSNYRMPYVKSLFDRLDVDITAGLNFDAESEDLRKAGFRSYESFINYLVQRRNDLAHSYGDDDLIEPDLLKTYVDLVSAYLNAVERVANHSIITRLSALKLTPLGSVEHEWTGRVGIKMTAGKVRLKDQLLFIKERRSTSHTINSLQSKEDDYDELIYSGNDIEVAAAINQVPSGTKSSLAYIIGDEWSEFWPPEDK